MQRRTGFQSEPLTDMVAVGRIGTDKVWLWARSRYPGRLTAEWWPAKNRETVKSTFVELQPQNNQDNTATLEIPSKGQLASLTRYQFRVVHERGHLVGEGDFETAPASVEETPLRYSIGMMSCHQPFNKKGAVQNVSVQMLRAVRKCLKKHNTKMIFMMGDQMYADRPSPRSLFNTKYFRSVAPAARQRIQECTAEEVRSLYQERYRHFWGLRSWQALQAKWPCYPILDDHEIVDNWGSAKEHQKAEWQSVGQGARKAYFDYQGSRLLAPANGTPGSFHYSLRYGNSVFFVMDLRSQRIPGAKGQLVGQEQKEAFKQFLQKHRHQSVLGIVLSVPPIHLPGSLARMAARIVPGNEDFSDRWSTGGHKKDRDWLFRTVHAHQLEHPNQQVLLLGGDIHIGCAHRIQWPGSAPPLYQLVSSPVSHQASYLARRVSELIIRFNRTAGTYDGKLRGRISLLKGTEGFQKNPYGNLNIGIVQVETPANGGLPAVRYFLYGHDGEQPVCVYRSPRLSNG